MRQAIKGKIEQMHATKGKCDVLQKKLASVAQQRLQIEQLNQKIQQLETQNFSLTS